MFLTGLRLFLILFVGSSCSAIANDQMAEIGQDITFGKRYIISSSALNEDREILVSLPASYQTSGRIYPVIYVLHGDFYFKYGVAYAEQLARQGNIPEAIIVGVTHGLNDNSYLVHGTPKADKFVEFIEKDVLPFVDGNFRTVGHRTLAGWHHTASFTLHILLNRPELFTGYVAASPFPLRLEEVNLQTLSEVLNRDPENVKTLYFGADDLESMIGESANEFATLLETEIPDSLRWFYNNKANDIEITDTVYRFLHPGLREVFRDFKSPEFSDIEAFNQQGGLTFMDGFFAHRSKKYGVVDKISPQAIFGLLRLAMGADDIVLFEKVLGSNQIVAEEWHVNWYNRFGRFLLKHQKAAKASSLFFETANLYPNHVQTHAALAGAYQMNHQPEAALATIETAIKLARAQSDPQLQSLIEEKAQIN